MEDNYTERFMETILKNVKQTFPSALGLSIPFAVAIFFATWDYQRGPGLSRALGWAFVSVVAGVLVIPILILSILFLSSLILLVMNQNDMLGKIKIRVDMDILKTSLDLERNYGIDYFNIEEQAQEVAKFQKYMNGLFGKKPE